MKTKPFSELRNPMTPEQRVESETRAKLMSLHLTLMELQESLGLTQDDLEKNLSDVESTVFELKNQEDKILKRQNIFTPRIHTVREIPNRDHLTLLHPSVPSPTP